MKNDSKNIIASIFAFRSQGSNNQNSNISQQQTFPPSFQQTNNNSNMNSAPIQFSTSNQSEPSYNQQNQQNRSFFNPGQPSYSTAVHFPPSPSTNNLFSSGITNPNIAKNNPADYFRPSNHSNNTKTTTSLFETSSNRTQKKEKGYRHKKGTELRVQ